MKKIVLTGGGTAGHVTPNIALLPALQAAGYEIAYVGSYEGIEKKLIADFNIPYTGISTGKFRRYLDPKNFSDPFRVMKGFVEARNYLKNYQPDVVFSKGAVHSRSRKGMLQFPGDYEKYPCRQGCPDRFSHSCGAGTGQPAGRTEHVRLYCQ